jgi:hypothetical protein
VNGPRQLHTGRVFAERSRLESESFPSHSMRSG